MSDLISEFNLRKYQNEGNNLVDGTEFLSNVKEQVISFYFEPTGESVFFKAFITTFSDTYTPSYNSTQVFGRTDPIHVFQNTTRDISLAFDVPAASESEAFENLGRIQKLIRMLYPGYLDVDDALSLTEAPLVRMKVMNLLANENSFTNDSEAQSSADSEKKTLNSYYTKYRSTSAPSMGTLGIIKSCTFQHNLENPQNGVFYKGPNTVLPKTISVNLSFTPFHEKTIGREMNTSYQYTETGEIVPLADRPVSKTFPYGVDLGDDAPSNVKPAGGSKTKAEQLRKTAEEKRRTASSAQQELDKQEARYARAMNRAQSRSARRTERGNAKGAAKAQAKYDSNREALEDGSNAAQSYLDAADQAAAAEKEYKDFLL